MNTISLAVAGFSLVNAVLMLVVYLWLIDFPNRSAYSIVACIGLLGAMSALQLGHLVYFTGGPEPLSAIYYRVALFVAPPFFYFFARWAVMPNVPVRPIILLNLLPIALIFVGRFEITLPILFMFGAGYSLWLGNVVYGLRAHRKQFRFEFFYFTIVTVIALIVLVLGFSIPYIDHDIFYHFYCLSIGLAYAIMTTALIAKPELISDLTEAAQIRYGATTLKDVDVEACLKKLETLMTVGKVYQNENLGLASLAAQVGLSSHQLSELINSRIEMGFSRYVRERRVAAAKELLVSAPSQSILSISMDTGFSSQSTFYAAFKEITGQSPGDYRKANLRKPE